MLRWHSVRRKQHKALQAELSSGTPSMLSGSESRRVSRSMSVKGGPTAADYMPLPLLRDTATSAQRKSPPATLSAAAAAQPNGIDPMEPIAALGGLTPTKESRVAALRRRSSMVRDKWATKMEFLLAVIGYAVDLGNIWRFPSVCYKHGGGAFLIPYFIMLMIGGLPIFYMELVLGQFHRAGCISIWRKVCPLFRGIGYGICCICTFIAIFYNAIIAQAVYFTFSSIALEVPWKNCNNSWNTPRCSDDLNVTSSKFGEKLTSPSEEYYLYNVLEVQKSTGFDDLGGVKPTMAICLAIVFTLVYFALWKGPQSSGKMVWVTATAPYLILSILLIRGLTLPGATKGILYYVTPNFEQLSDPAVWSAAATQIFFSLGPGFGVLLALSSYNDFNNNCYRDAVVTSIINCATSFFSGCVVFSTLGYMSELTNRPVNEVVGEHDASLIFIVYPQALATMNYSSFWSFIFFVMLITLGIDSTFAGIEALITGFCDESRFLTKNRKWFVLVVCIIYYFASFPAISYGGQYVISFLDDYGVSLSVLFIVTCEMIAVCWFYGIDQFSKDIRAMLGFYPGIYWRFCWTCSPIFISVIFAMTVYNSSFKPIVMANYTFPWWSVPFGWSLRLLSVLAIPGFGLIYLMSGSGSIKDRFKWAITPQQRRTSAISLAADPTQIIDSSLLDPIHTLTPV